VPTIALDLTKSGRELNFQTLQEKSMNGTFNLSLKAFKGGYVYIKPPNYSNVPPWKSHSALEQRNPAADREKKRQATSD